MNKSYDVAVYIGRFQPLHNAHVESLRYAAKIAEKVIVIVGSALQPRDLTNPFTEDERINSMLAPELERLSAENKCTYVVTYNFDTIYDHDSWVSRTQDLVDDNSKKTDRVCIVGYAKDGDTTEYLQMFPQWEFRSIPQLEILNATQIRDFYLSSHYNESYLIGVCPKDTLAFLSKFSQTEEYKELVELRYFIEDYRSKYASLPFPPVFVTVDAVVVQSGHVLLVKRRAAPGKGLWALPGGFFDAENDISVETAMLRELKEETAIDVPIKVLKGSISGTRVFDAKKRSGRGRTITHAFKISLTGGEWKLPKVKGMDDAEKAQWVPFSQLSRRDLFEDHFDIISHFVKF